MLQRKTLRIALFWRGSSEVRRPVVFMEEQVLVCLPLHYGALTLGRIAQKCMRGIVGEEPSGLSSRADALSAYQVDPLGPHRATKPKKRKKKTTTKNLNKTSNLSECEDSLASTSDEEQRQEEVLQGNVEDLSAGKIGARRWVRSRQFNITLKRATQTGRNRIKLLSVSEEGKLLCKYEVSSARDWLVMGPTLYQLTQLRVAVAKISWRAERWRSASIWFGFA